MEGVQKPIVGICTPTVTRPWPECLEAMEASVHLINAAGFDAKMTVETGCPYISAARATMLRRALDGNAEIIVFIDHDLSWPAGDLLKLIQTPGEVVAGTYRFKTDVEEYMGGIEPDADGDAQGRADGALLAERVPAGFLKITRGAVERFMRAYPELSYGSPINPSTDLFNHGAWEGGWYGEDYAFCRRWRALGQPIWLVPDLSLTHHSADTAYPGNYHQFLMRQPGGALHPDTLKAA